MPYGFLKASMETLYTFEKLEKEKIKKKEENHWRKHEIADSFLVCAEIVSFGLTPKLSYSIQSSHVLVNY